MLVVIAIIATLAAILFPVFAQTREKARQTACLSNLKQMGNAVMMYAQGNDEILPATGWQGPCTNPQTLATNDANFFGFYSFPLAIQPYVKNYGVLVYPSDTSGQGGFNKTNSTCYESQLVQMKVPGAYVGRGTALEMASLADIKSPSSVFYLTDVGSSGDFAGWYIAPGYGNSKTGKGPWEQGGRHAGGRNWIFCDGHAKWSKDPDFNTADMGDAYRKRGIYTDYETETNS